MEGRVCGVAQKEAGGMCQGDGIQYLYPCLAGGPTLDKLAGV